MLNFFLQIKKLSPLPILLLALFALVPPSLSVAAGGSVSVFLFLALCWQCRCGRPSGALTRPLFVVFIFPIPACGYGCQFFSP